MDTDSTVYSLYNDINLIVLSFIAVRTKRFSRKGRLTVYSSGDLRAQANLDNVTESTYVHTSVQFVYKNVHHITDINKRYKKFCNLAPGRKMTPTLQSGINWKRIDKNNNHLTNSLERKSNSSLENNLKTFANLFENSNHNIVVCS